MAINVAKWWLCSCVVNLNYEYALHKLHKFWGPYFTRLINKAMGIVESIIVQFSRIAQMAYLTISCHLKCELWCGKHNKPHDCCNNNNNNNGDL